MDKRGRNGDEWKTRRVALARIRRTMRRRKRSNRHVLAAAATLSLVGGVVAVCCIVSILADYGSARGEYDALRRNAPVIRSSSVSPSASAAPTPDSAAPAGEREVSSSLSDRNQDYIGWLRIPGTAIDYPVVRGSDNEQYLATTFSGETNPSGAIFMDYRCAQGWEGSAVVLYGHNMKDGSMFSDLSLYLDSAFLERNSEIMVTFPDGEARVYSIFSVRITDVNDDAYAFLASRQEGDAAKDREVSASEGRVLVLSTCTDSNRATERLVVLAACHTNSQ